MNFYFAPMEGITGYIFRNAWADFFGGMDQYFTPFISPNNKKGFTTKEKRDVLPEHNSGKKVVPQILTGNSEYFLEIARRLKEYGYSEINLNLGCPSGTVVTKKKGAGFLAYPEELSVFLEEIFEAVHEKEGMEISIKTRLGMEKEEEFYKILEIYNTYPLKELIVHPRVQKDFYKKPVHLDFFEEIEKNSRASVCYNGDIFTPEQYQSFIRRFPTVESIMLGRGILVNPGLLEEIQTKRPMEKERLYHFLERLSRDYKEELSGEIPVLYKLKELWFYLGHSFENSEKYMKKIKKAATLSEYERMIDQIFAEQKLRQWTK